MCSRQDGADGVTERCSHPYECCGPRHTVNLCPGFSRIIGNVYILMSTPIRSAVDSCAIGRHTTHLSTAAGKIAEVIPVHTIISGDVSCSSATDCINKRSSLTTCETSKSHCANTRRSPGGAAVRRYYKGRGATIRIKNILTI